VRALYLASTEATAWAEWYRHSAELGVPPQTRLPRSVYRFEVEVDGVADLTAADVLAAHGLAQLMPTRRQWPRTQPIGEAYWRAGWRGLLVPSAAHAEGRVLVVFRDKNGEAAGVKPMPRPRLHEELPPLPVGLRT